MNNKSGAQGDPKGGSGDQQIKVGDKTYTVDDVKGLVSQVSSNAKTVQDATKVLDAAKAYNLEPNEFLDQAIGGLTVVSNLIDSGIIDNEGKVIEKKPASSKEPGDKTTGNPELDKLLGIDTSEGSPPAASDKTAAIVAKALGPIGEKLEGLGRQLGEVSDIQTSIIRDNFSTKLMAKFPGLTENDVSKVFATAARDKSKSIWDHAQAMVETNEQGRVAIEKAFAEKHDLNYEELTKEPDENALKEPGAKGGAAPLPEGKKISFRPNRDPKTTITPLEASEPYYKAKDLESKGG
jgi:hypothetical protein